MIATSAGPLPDGLYILRVAKGRGAVMTGPDVWSPVLTGNTPPVASDGKLHFGRTPDADL